MILGLPPLLNKTALFKIGWTPTLIAALLAKPDHVHTKARGVYRWVEHLYTRDRVIEAMQDERFLALIERRKARQLAIEKRKAELPKKYASWKDALPEACAGMLSLNRHAKHRSCSELNRIEIYHLKNELIRLLYQHGYATACFIHRLQLDAQICRECGGAGDAPGYLCGRCGGTGVWRAAKTLEFWCFRFAIAGKEYCWHQPRNLVSFGPVETVPPQEMDTAAFREEKPLLVTRGKFAEVKELLRWVIERAGSDESDGEPERAVSQGEGFPFELFAAAPSNRWECAR